MSHVEERHFKLEDTVPPTVDLPDIEQGAIHSYLIYDVADTIDLAKLKQRSTIDFSNIQLELKPVKLPSYIQFTIPPLAAHLNSIEVEDCLADLDLKLYDYGTIAIRVSIPFSGSWPSYVHLAQTIRQSTTIGKRIDEVLSSVLERISFAVCKPHAPILEDYFILEVQKFHTPVTSTELLVEHKEQLASLILGEKNTLSPDEQAEAIRHSFSYLNSDLVIVQWDAAFVFDTKEGAEAVENILEFANSQLVELRTYDRLLDEELDEIYKWGLGRKQPHWLWGRRAVNEQTNRLRCLLVDVRELSERSTNALKIIGDAFYARVYRAISHRLCLSDWQQQLESKLESIAGVYRFATDQAQHARSEFLEIIIIILIALEIVLTFGR